MDQIDKKWSKERPKLKKVLVFSTKKDEGYRN